MYDSNIVDMVGDQIGESYIVYLVSTNQRPVYHYRTGDIELHAGFVTAFVRAYIEQRYTSESLYSFYERFLVPVSSRKDNIIFSSYIRRELTGMGIRFLNALMNRFGDMLEDSGTKDYRGRYSLGSYFSF